MDRGAWWVIVHRVTKIQTWLKWLGMASLDSWIKSLSFYMPSGHFLMGLWLMITSCFSLKHMEQNLITVLPRIWVLIIYQTKDTLQKSRTMEQDVYWKQDQGLRSPVLIRSVTWEVKKKNAYCENCKVSFIWGKMKTAVCETAPQIALRNCSKEHWGKVSKGGIQCNQAFILQKVFC